MVRRDVPPPPSKFLPELHPMFEKLILHALEKSPAARPQTADDMLQELGELFETLVQEHRKKSQAAPESSIIDPPTADTRISRLGEPSDEDTDDTLEGESDPTTLKRNMAGIRKLIDSMIGSNIDDSPSIESITQKTDIRLSVEDEPSTLDPTEPKPNLRRPYPDAQSASEEVITIPSPLSRGSLDSEAPIPTVVIDSKPLVDAARMELDSEAPISTRVADQKPVRDAVRSFEAKHRQQATLPTSVAPVVTSAPNVDSLSPGTMRSASPSVGARPPPVTMPSDGQGLRPAGEVQPSLSQSPHGGLPVVVPPASQGVAPSAPIPRPDGADPSDPLPPSEWPMSNRDYRNELEKMLQDMPGRPSAATTLLVVLLVGAAVGALVWVMFLY